MVTRFEGVPMDSSRQARCPRCGYDLRGVVTTWAAACPLESRCSECGLDFEWAQVIGTRYPPPGWCVEYALSPWGVPWRSIKTMALAAWPWGFWRSLKMSHEVRWRRIAVYVVLLALPLYVVQGSCNGLAAWMHWRDAVAYGARSLPSPVKVVVQSALLPYSDTSPGAITYPAGMYTSRPFTTPFPPPARQLEVVWGGLFDSPILLLLLGTTVLCPAGFLALPVSRRRAKVRYAHIHRVTLYSATILVLPIGGLLAEPSLQMLGGYFWTARILWVAAVAAIVVEPVLLVIWWSCATGRYLKIRHPWGVGLAVVVMAMLSTVLTAILIYLLVT
jgi:hypothetical protein